MVLYGVLVIFLTSQLVGIAETINLSIEVDNGLGTHQSELTNSQFETFQKVRNI